MDTQYVELKDKHGNTLFFGNMVDVIIPPFPAIQDFRQHKKDIVNMDLNPCDIIITGFPKTGTHWNLEIIQMLIKGSSEYEKDQGHASFIELTPVSTKGPLPPPDKPRCLFTHLRFDQLPKQVFEKKVKLVYLQRNPKDTWVSYYNHAKGHTGKIEYNGTWSQFFELMLTFGYWYGDWFDYVLDWERVLATQTEVPIITMFFEELKKDPVGQIQRLDKFLGFNRGPELCEQIADACSFTKLKHAKESMMPAEIKSKIFKKDSPGFYRKGDIGDWKNWFTVAQNEQFDALYAKIMEGCNIKYIYEM